VPRYVPLADGFRLDVGALAAQVGPQTRACVLNTPHNPTGRVFDADEVGALCRLCVEKDLLLFTDEIYEEILYTGVHRSPASWPDMAERTVIVSGASKTYSVTGWRIGWIVTPPALTDGVRKVHDFLTVGAPAPLQEAIARALRWEPPYYETIRAEYLERRDLLIGGLRDAGFDCTTPEGAYYVMVDVGHAMRAGESDTDFAMRLVRDAGVATVPGSSFYADPADGARQVRFCYAKKLATLQDAVDRLRDWARA
jgi:aminotransferase